MGLNLMLKVLGKEFEEEPFFKRVFLNITCKTSIRVPPLWERLYIEIVAKNYRACDIRLGNSHFFVKESSL